MSSKDLSASSKTEKPAEKAEPTTAKPSLAKAGASGDAGVQNLIARRAHADAAGHDAVVAEIDAELAELGYEL
jgi:hypothetical protein